MLSVVEIVAFPVPAILVIPIFLFELVENFYSAFLYSILSIEAQQILPLMPLHVRFLMIFRRIISAVEDFVSVAIINMTPGLLDALATRSLLITKSLSKANKIAFCFVLSAMCLKSDKPDLRKTLIPNRTLCPRDFKNFPVGTGKFSSR